ncbi:hypothetical protein EYF80_010756 [Liparis tanakae]|uniref:Uncharacterized protein n=1 Tax=Liparis tanakae TaxID=230148 RepID=A0A4Z2IMS7_9TELE|nr:hypothetical protein EYF80_010756 [Liparis tanakae]
MVSSSGPSHCCWPLLLLAPTTGGSARASTLNDGHMSFTMWDCIISAISWAWLGVLMNVGLLLVRHIWWGLDSHQHVEGRKQVVHREVRKAEVGRFLGAQRDLKRKVIDISGLEARAKRRIQRVALVLGDRKAESDDPKVLADTDDLPEVQLLFGVLLQRIEGQHTLIHLLSFHTSS